MEGKGIVVLFDDNDKFIDMHFLRFGDVLVTFKGAHSLKTSDILMIECKNGPFVDTKHWIE